MILYDWKGTEFQFVKCSYVIIVFGVTHSWPLAWTDPNPAAVNGPIGQRTAGTRCPALCDMANPSWILRTVCGLCKWQLTIVTKWCPWSPWTALEIWDALHASPDLQAFVCSWGKPGLASPPWLRWRCNSRGYASLWQAQWRFGSKSPVQRVHRVFLLRFDMIWWSFQQLSHRCLG